MKKSPTRFIRRVDNKFTSASLDLNFQNMEVMDSRVTFSRGSNATLFDSSGNLVYAKHNLLLQSEDFGTTWTSPGTTVTTNTEVAPDGTTTADTITADAGTSNHNVGQSFTSIATAYTFSVFAKAGTLDYIQLRYGASVGGGYVNFDITSGAGAVGTSGGSGSPSGTITDAGNGWYRCSLTATISAGSAGAAVFLVTSSSAASAESWTAVGTETVYIWGAQLNITPMEGGVTSSLSTYYPTVASAYYAPRFDHNPATLESLGLLIEEQRTNSIRNNTMQGAVVGVIGSGGSLPTNWFTFTSLTGLTREVVAVGTENGINYVDFRLSGTPGGTLPGTLTLFLESLGNIVAAPSQVWTSSAYVKLVGGSLTNISSINIGLQARTAAGGFLAQYTGLATPTGTLTRASFTGPAMPASTERAEPVMSIGFTAGVASDITLRIGLPQLELGAFATSVIPTTTAAATRNADLASMTGTNFSSWYNQSASSFYVDYLISTSRTTDTTFFRVDDGSDANRIQTATGASFTVFNSFLVASNVSQGTNTSPVNPLGSHKTSFGVTTNSSTTVADGTIGATDTSVNMPSSLTRATIGNSNNTGSFINGHIRRIAYYPVRLSNDQLQALTR